MKTKLRPLEKQTVVVVGASSGMGRMTALQAARRGARVVVAARNVAALDSLVAEIQKAGGDALAVETDVTVSEQVEALAEAVIARYGGFDTWAHFAATSIYSPFGDMSPEEFRRVIDVNLIGAGYSAMVALRHLRTRGRGALILVSSVEGEVALPFHSAYAASKHGIDGLFDSIRLELAHAGSPVSVTLVKPTGVNTPFFNNAKTKIGVKPKPARPIYQPEHVADAVLFAAEHPTRELFVGGAAKFLVLLKRLAPRLSDAILLETGFSGQRTREPKSAGSPSGLFHPDTQEQRVHGDFGAEAKKHSLYTWLQTHPTVHRLVKALALIAGATWLAERYELIELSDAERAWKRARRGARRLADRW